MTARADALEGRFSASFRPCALRSLFLTCTNTKISSPEITSVCSISSYVRVGAVPIDVKDTVGAGDSFGAALLAGLADHDALGLDATRSLDDSLLEEAVAYAVKATPITCTRTGAVPPSRAEIDAWVGSLTGEGGAGEESGGCAFESAPS